MAYRKIKKTETDKKREVISLKTIFILFLIIMTLWPVYKMGYPMLEGEGLVYWANAKSMQGISVWKEYIDSQSVFAYGYSTLLMIAGKLIHHTVYLYKGMIAGNVIFFVLSYEMLTRIVLRMRDKQSEAEILSVCFLVMLLPVYTNNKVFLGPQMILLLLFLLITDGIQQICRTHEKEKNKKQIIRIGICLAVGVWLHSSFLAVLLGTVFFFMIQGKHLEADGESWICGGILLGIAIIFILFFEQAVSMKIWPDVLDHNAGIVRLPVHLSNTFDQAGITGILTAMAGKWFYLLAGSLFLILPGIWWLMEKSVEDKKETGYMKYYLIIIVSFVFLMEAANDAAETGTELFKDDFLMVILTPVLAGGMCYLLRLNQWREKMILWTVCAVCSAGVASDLLKGSSEQFMGLHNGIIPLTEVFSHNTEDIPVLTTAVLLAIVLSAAVIYHRIKDKKDLKRIYFVALTMGLVVLQSAMLQKFVFEKQKNYREYKIMAQKIEEMPSQVYTLYDEKNLEIVALIQSLCQKEMIRIEEPVSSPEEWRSVTEKLQDEKASILLSTDQQWMMDQNPFYGEKEITEKMILYVPEKKTTEKKKNIVLDQDEMKELSVMADIVNIIKRDSTLDYVVREDLKEKSGIDISRLQKYIPDTFLGIATMEEIEHGRKPDWLILKGFEGRYRELLDDYVIEHIEGPYTLLMKREAAIRDQDKMAETEEVFREKWNRVWEQIEEQ